MCSMYLIDFMMICSFPLWWAKLCGPGNSFGIVAGYGLDDRIPVGGKIFLHLSKTSPGAYPASCTISTGSFLGVKSGQDMTLTPHSLLVPWSRKGRAIPLLPLWAVRPVRSLSACTRVHFTVRPVQSLRACTRVHFTVRPVQSLSACTRVHFTPFKHFKNS
jgi:hypothetical protein